MEYLGTRNLFISEFVMGCREADYEYTQTKTLEIEVLKKWLDFKDADWGMGKYRSERTQYVCFLCLIDLWVLKDIINDLIKIYQNEYPFSTKDDFIDKVFKYTLYDLNEIVERRYVWLGEPNEAEFIFYTYYSHSDREFFDFVVPSDKDIEYYQQYYKKVIQLINEIDFEGVEQKTNTPQQTEKKSEQEQPKTFEELFYKSEHAEICLSILRELQPPVIDAINNYIGKAKGIFPLWVEVLKNRKPEPLIKHFADKVYKDLLNEKIKGLNLSKDASEFRKQYKRLYNDKKELDIKTILSQYSQSGKLGK